ncbi:MAG: dTDP-glucose 4,6-dehydratase, partial [Thermoleophilaceae bacterium]|nr:dTDP-glucose 4,6-dehydratase [Thermoleophilaceae bacterium]
FEGGLRDTIAWFIANDDWWRRAKSGDWADYYERQYGERLADSIEA